jgi:hypothetical protein
LIRQWGKKFQRDHDIMPLFSDVYNALVKKGVEFPGESAAEVPQSSPNSAGSPMISKKNV